MLSLGEGTRALSELYCRESHGMPRVNRDLQRRLAARRERERRRPAPERRYRFQAAEPDAVDPELEEDIATDGAAQAPAAEPPTRARREGRLVQTERAPARPFTEYALEYAYVITDLRRLGLVVGIILIVLVVLYFVLPR